MKFFILSLCLLFTFFTGRTQIKSYDYYGNYAFIDRNMWLVQNKKAISEKKIKKIKIDNEIPFNGIRSNSWDIYWHWFYFYYFDKKGDWIRVKYKNANQKSKLKSVINSLNPSYWHFRKSSWPKILKIDSTTNGLINHIIYLDNHSDNIIETYKYDTKGNLIYINTGHDVRNLGIKGGDGELKEVKLEYDSIGNLIKERIYFVGDSSIVKHEYIDKRMVKSTRYSLYQEWYGEKESMYYILKPRVEVINYYYNTEGFLSAVELVNEKHNIKKYMKFSYIKFK